VLGRADSKTAALEIEGRSANSAQVEKHERQADHQAMAFG
jgi:hypothetical protein